MDHSVKIYNPSDGTLGSRDEICREFSVQSSVYYVENIDGTEVRSSKPPDHDQYSQCLEFFGKDKQTLEFVKYILCSTVKTRRFLNKMMEDM